MDADTGGNTSNLMLDQRLGISAVIIEDKRFEKKSQVRVFSVAERGKRVL